MRKESLLLGSWNAVDYTGISASESSESSNRVIGFAMVTAKSIAKNASSTSSSLTGDSSRLCEDAFLLLSLLFEESPFSKSSPIPRSPSNGSITKSLRQHGHSGPSRCFINHSSMQAVWKTWSHFGLELQTMSLPTVYSQRQMEHSFGIFRTSTPSFAVWLLARIQVDSFLQNSYIPAPCGRPGFGTRTKSSESKTSSPSPLVLSAQQDWRGFVSTGSSNDLHDFCEVSFPSIAASDFPSIFGVAVASSCTASARTKSSFVKVYSCREELIIAMYGTKIQKVRLPRLEKSCIYWL